MWYLPQMGLSTKRGYPQWPGVPKKMAKGKVVGLEFSMLWKFLVDFRGVFLIYLEIHA